MSDTRKQENAVQREAFEFYYQLGEQRSLKAVAEHFKKNERTVAGWSGAFNWVDRVNQRTVEERESSAKDFIQMDIKIRYRKLFYKLVHEAIKDVNAGKIRIKNIADLERVVKMDLALIDNPIDGIGTGTARLEPEDKKAIDDLIRELKGGLDGLRA